MKKTDLRQEADRLQSKFQTLAERCEGKAKAVGLVYMVEEVPLSDAQKKLPPWPLEGSLSLLAGVSDPVTGQVQASAGHLSASVRGPPCCCMMV